jgi:DNA-binding HxlR family transcriptional regulator
VARKLPVRQECVCAVGGIIDLVGKKWTMCAIVTLGNRPGIRFNALMEALSGISPRTLSETLKALEREGLAERTAYPEIPPRVEYRLTPEGLRLREAVRPLMEYAAARPDAVCPPLATVPAA